MKVIRKGLIVALNRFSAYVLVLIPGYLFVCYAVCQSVDSVQGVPFKDGIEIKINGQGPFHFGVDTGAAGAFLIDPELAQRLHLPTVSKTYAQGFKDSGCGPAVEMLRIDLLQLAGHSFRNVIGVGFSGTPGGGGGTLGIGLFNDLLLKLDYVHDKLFVSEGSLPVSDGKTVLTYTDAYHAHPFIPVVLGGVPTSAMLDTGARSTGADLMAPFQLVQKLHLMAPMQESGTVKDILGHSYTRYIATLDGDLMIGDLQVHRPTLLISDMLPVVTLGGICNRLAITLDHRNHRLKLEMPSSR